MWVVELGTGSTEESLSKIATLSSEYGEKMNVSSRLVVGLQIVADRIERNWTVPVAVVLEISPGGGWWLGLYELLYGSSRLTKGETTKRGTRIIVGIFDDLIARRRTVFPLSRAANVIHRKLFSKKEIPSENRVQVPWLFDLTDRRVDAFFVTSSLNVRCRAIVVSASKRGGASCG